MDRIRVYIDEFIATPSARQYSSKPATARNLFGLEPKGRSHELLAMCREHNNMDIHDKGLLAIDIKESVIAYKNSKQTAIQLYKAFVKFLAVKKQIKLDIQFPKIDVSNQFDRIMFMVKYFQEPTHTKEGLIDELWLSEQIIEDDMEKLQGYGSSISFNGRKLIISDITTNRSSRYNFASTMHPIVLTHNLGQVLTNLKGLHAMHDDPYYKGWAMSIATDIWCQLTAEYARQRLRYLADKYFPEEKEWFSSLDDAIQKQHNNMFTTEPVTCSGCGKDAALYYMKNSMPFCIEYQGEEGNVFYENIRILQSGNPLIVAYHGQKLALDASRIIACGDSEKDILLAK